MNASAWWCRCRAEVQSFFGSGVEPTRRSCEELPQILNASIDIATDEISVVLLQRQRREHATCEHQGTKAGCESLNLRLNTLGHINSRSVRDMTVRPCR